MTKTKNKRSLRNLIYRMRKLGYEINRKEHVAVMSERRRKKLEHKLMEYGFNVQYKMYHHE